MLAFFRKYEKTFFLIVFLPAIIGMGVTSVIVTVLTQKPEGSPGQVFGEPIPLHDWQSVIGPYTKLMGRSDEGSDAHFRFYAYTKAAERAGIRVSDAEVADSIINKTGLNIARLKAAERIRDSGVDPQSDDGRRKFQQFFLEEISHSRENFTDADYEKFLHAYGITMGEYEAHQRRVMMQEKLEETIREAATLAPEEIWKEFRDKNQKREAEVVTIDATAYVPSAGTVPTDAEVKTYYEAHRALYDEPKRVALDYVAAPFEKTRAALPAAAEDALKDYYEKHKSEWISVVGTIATVQSFQDVRAKVEDKFQTQASKERAQTLLEQVAAKLDEQRKAGKIDMKAAVDAVPNKGELVQGNTGLLEPDEYFTHQLLGGFSSQRWASSEPVSPTRTSDPLKGEKCVAILRTADVKEKKVPTFDEIREQVKKDYVAGGERELKKYYNENQWKYRTKDKWRFELATAKYERFVDASVTVTPDEVNAFWANRHFQMWPGQEAAAVGSDAIATAAKADKMKGKAAETLEKLRKECQQSFVDHKRADLDLIVNKFDGIGYETLTMDREDLEKDARLKVAATAIPLARRDEPTDFSFEASDGRSKFFFVLKEKIEQKVPELAEIHDQVAKDVLQARGYERAKAAAEKLLLDLKDLTGDALAAALKAQNLTSVKTGNFSRTATALPGITSEGPQIVAETFNCKKPGSGFERSVPDDLNKKVYLVRCAGRQDPADDALTNGDRVTIRHDLLKKKKSEYVTEKMTDITLRAKGISDEHVKWVRARRDGPQGRVSGEVRQVFVPNDKATIDGWLEDAARKKIDEALAKLRADTKWERVCLDYSEDEGTRARGGELTVSRGDLADSYGFEFESKLFDLPADGQVSVPLKSKKGLHLVKVVKGPSAGGPDDPNHGLLRMTFRHILVKTDAKLREMPQSVTDKAREISRKKIEDAKARIEKGEPFAKVAAEVGDESDAHAKGESFTVPYMSTVMLKSLEQPLETQSADLAKVEPFEVKVGDATEWHILLNSRDPQDKEPAFRAGPLAPRVAFECVGSSKDALVSARRKLEDWAKNRPDHDPTGAEIVKEWKKIIHDYSTAITAKKEGAFGLVSLDPALRQWDLKAIAVLATLDAGKRSDIVETKDGFHYIECLSVETKPADDPARQREIADEVLRGTEWTTTEPASN